jgi:hypothetical protein
MIEVYVEIREEPTPLKVAVRAESIIRAVDIIEGRHPGRDVRVVFPIDPEDFFVGDSEETWWVR